MAAARSNAAYDRNEALRANRARARFLRRIDNFCAIMLVVGIVAAIGLMIVVAAVPKNTDPREGNVDVGNGVTKFCDGTTLIYSSQVRGGESVSTVAHSDECAP